MKAYETFPADVADALGYYVYRLIDPRNGETFYVGKGTGNRVFAHAADALKEGGSAGEADDEQSQKRRRIRAIHAAGLTVGTVIHRHGMDEATAYEVEAALIDAYPGLANEQGGHGSDYSPMHTKEILSRYAAPVADLGGFAGSLIIKVQQATVDDICGGSVYEAVRSAWRLSAKLIENNTVPYVFAVINGIIRGVYAVTAWHLVPETGRLAFTGSEAAELSRFVGQHIPPEYRQKAAASPVLYIK